MAEMIGAPVLAPATSGLGGGQAEPPDRLRQTAQEFEAVFIAQMLAGMTSGLAGEGPLGAGEGDPFRGMLGDEIAKVISRAGGVGVADAVLREMLKLQEVA